MATTEANQSTAILLIHCPDKPGLIALVTDFINANGGNIIYLDQHVDRTEGVFFMRVEWELENFVIPRDKINEYFGTLYGQKYDMDFRLYFSDDTPRMAIFVSKMSHCIYDLLARYTAGEWNVAIPVIISNHPDLQTVAERFGIEFHCFPITKDTKAEQEALEVELLKKHKIDFIVLARYMQVVSPNFIKQYPNSDVAGETGGGVSGGGTRRFFDGSFRVSFFVTDGDTSVGRGRPTSGTL